MRPNTKVEDKGWETGSVKFFDSRPDKNYGFLVLDDGEEIFIHLNDGVLVSGSPDGGMKFDTEANITSGLHMPRKYDTIMFQRRPGKKGPVASPWVSLKDYNRAYEVCFRPIKFSEAKSFLSLDTERDVLIYRADNVGTEVTKVTWNRMIGEEKLQVARGVFVTREGKRTKGEVTIDRIPSGKFEETMFEGLEAFELKDSGWVNSFRVGERCGVMWNGGWDDFVINRNQTRVMTEEEAKDSIFPTFQTEEGTWLRGHFSHKACADTHAVKILTRLDHGD